MAEKVDAQVHFYDKYSGAIKYKTNSKNEEKKEFGQIVAFDCLAVRQMLNSDTSTARKIAFVLSELSASISEDEISEIIEKRFTDSATLVKYKGGGKKQFLININWSPDTINYKVNHKGFGFFGKDVNWYAPNSVFIFFKYLAKNSSDDRFRFVLTDSAHQCGSSFILNKLNRLNQRMFPLEIARSYYV